MEYAADQLFYNPVELSPERAHFLLQVSAYEREILGNVIGEIGVVFALCDSVNA